MRRSLALLGSGIFLVVAPGIVAGLIPWWITRWQIRPAFFGVSAIRILGGILIAEGVPILLDSFIRFAVQGLGTPAPVAPTQHLVITGLYRFVRNPMYVGVLLTILGQALVFGDSRLLIYSMVIFIGFHIFVLTYEEPTLRKTYGEEYENFCANVPRWVPQLKPWNGD